MTVTEQTSREAFEDLDPGRAQWLLLNVLAEHGPDTVMNLELAAGRRDGLWKRASELVARGWAQWTGEKKRNPTGRRAAVLALTDAGRARYDRTMAGD